MDLQHIHTRPEARVSHPSIASPGSLASAHDDELIRARLEYLAVAEWKDNGATGHWERVCHVLHGAIMMLGICNAEARADVELLQDIAHTHWQWVIARRMAA